MLGSVTECRLTPFLPTPSVRGRHVLTQACGPRPQRCFQEHGRIWRAQSHENRGQVRFFVKFRKTAPVPGFRPRAAPDLWASPAEVLRMTCLLVLGSSLRGVALPCGAGGNR